MSFTEAVRAFFARYSDFRGRSCRSELWWSVAFLFLAGIVLAVLDLAVLGRPLTAPLFQLAVLVPTWCQQIRRLHDLDRTGWWLLAPYGAGIVGVGAMLAAISTGGGTKGEVDIRVGLTFLVVFLAVGALVLTLFVWSLMRGTRGPNRFGPDPLAGQAA